MGQTLSEPVTLKDSSLNRNTELLVGASAMQGWRVNMEDAHTILLNMPGHDSCAYFALFDGHGGSKIAKYAANNLHKKLASLPDFENGNTTLALEKSFLELDSEMRSCKETRDELAGSTALVVLLRDSTVYCANVGDSRAVMCVGGRSVELSRDHKPSNQAERARICAAGGYVANRRVNGNLALSRALGDFVFKKNGKKSQVEQIVIAKPEIISEEVTDDAEFVVMGCDGIWDVLTNQEVVNFVRSRLAQGTDPDVCGPT